MPTSRTDAYNHYEKAYHLGKKEGGTPLVLDQILKEKHILAPTEVSLGLVHIPIERIVGTKSKGRSNAFSKGFYPLLNADSEFSFKWISLCIAHLDEGIRDAIKVYEFMNEFYIEEGNKRVSVLKYFGAVSVLANVIRIIPPQRDDKETLIYYEFMDFYSLSQINDIWFSKSGSFSKLQRLVGKKRNEMWTDEDRKDFHSCYATFLKMFKELGIPKKDILPGDAFLYFIDFYDYHDLLEYSQAEYKAQLKKIQDELLLLKHEQPVSLQMDPDTKNNVKNIFSRLIPEGMKKLRVCFIHAKSPEESSWIYAHELGRSHLQEAFADQIKTTCVTNVTEDTIAEALHHAVRQGNDLIFTTSPIFFKETVKAAIDFPEAKFLNCSLNSSAKHVRTYYARMYEAKFLMGAIAGALSENGRLGYIADYPIFGVTASINAFALGAKMVNPRAKVYLHWRTLAHADSSAFFKENEVSIISGKDMAPSGQYDRHFGLYCEDEKGLWNIAMPVWNWGRFYEQIIRNIMNGNWKVDDEKDSTKGRSYWWGMSSDMVDVLFSKQIPIGTLRLVDLLKATICRGDFNPFSGLLFAQGGEVKQESGITMSPTDIITMDWLAENVIGHIPDMEELQESAKNVAQVSGIKQEGNLK